jgi:thiosulfate dehydrogenase (quinone) large subunit
VRRIGSNWLLAGREKITSPAWGTNGTALMGFGSGALANAAGPHPSVQGWYVWFLQHIVVHATGLLLGLLTGIAAGSPQFLPRIRSSAARLSPR